MAKLDFNIMGRFPKISINPENRTGIRQVRIPQGGEDTFKKSTPSPTTDPIRIYHLSTAKITTNNPLCSPEVAQRICCDERRLNSILENNEEIRKILTEAGIETPKVELDNFKKIIGSHMKTTMQYATAIAKEMGCTSDEIRTLRIAAAVHDIGKVFVPSEILDSPGKLTPDERRIIDTHAETGAIVLKEMGFGKEITELVSRHHQPQDKLQKILTSADIVSALKEKRSYKDALPDEKVVSILRSDANTGKIPIAAADAVDKILANNPGGF